MEKLSRATLKLMILFLFFLPSFVYAIHPLDIIINEIAWMGTEKGWQYEWIELYNRTQKEIDISGWEMENASQKGKELEISQGNVLPNSYFLICKKGMKNCDFKSWALSLNNNYQENGKLVLKDRKRNIIDQTPKPDSNWPAGNNKTKQTMERKSELKTGSDVENWKTSQSFGGTPKAKNSVAVKVEKFSEKEIEKPEPKIYPGGIIINEILPDPKGISDAQGEYIEIFNQNNFEVNLLNWQIMDVRGRVRIYKFGEGTKISPQGFLVLSRPTTKITLNNKGDGLNLIQPDGKIIDGVNYEKAVKGKSYNLTNNGWVWSSILTSGLVNIIPQKTEKIKSLSKPEKIDINTASLKNLVNIVHIGKARAEQLISLRPFYSLNQLKKIKGIGQKVLEGIKKQGLAWVNPKLKPPQKQKKANLFEKEGAGVTKPMEKSYSDHQLLKFPIFLIGLVLAIFSGIIILILKKEMKEMYNKTT